jgi:hypothetical protein
MNSNICRICLEEDEINNMIYPCRCSGTSKYVHKDCLNQWRTLSDNIDAYKKCFECNYEYQISNNNTSYSPTIFARFCKFISQNLFGFFILNFAIIFILSNILSAIDYNKNLAKIFGASISSSGSNSTGYYSAEYYSAEISIYNSYFIWAAIFYASFLFSVALFNFICFIKNKRLYLKYCCKSKITLILVCFFLFGIIYSLNPYIAVFIFTIVVQVILKYHFIFMEKIREENGLDILNYDDESDLSNNNILNYNTNVPSIP